MNDEIKFDKVETLKQGSSSETILPCACISRWVHWYDDDFDDGDDDDYDDGDDDDDDNDDDDDDWDDDDGDDSDNEMIVW